MSEKTIFAENNFQENMKRIFLIGYMGAGKTSVGKVLAKRIGLSFIDLDSYIENRYQRTVGQLFEEKGEDAFRQIERNLLHEVAAFEDILISTGGGAPCFYDNIAFMNQSGTSVYLKVSVEELLKRLEVCKHTRPLLKNKTKEELRLFITKTLEKRKACYMQASVIFDAEEMYSDADVEAIAEALEKII